MKIEKISVASVFCSVVVSAGEAMKEKEAGRRSVILMEGKLACAALDMLTPSDGIYIRFDDQPASLCSLSVDTLILVRPSRLKNADYAIEHMLCSTPEPKIIEVEV